MTGRTGRTGGAVEAATGAEEEEEVVWTIPGGIEDLLETGSTEVPETEEEGVWDEEIGTGEEEERWGGIERVEECEDSPE